MKCNVFWCEKTPTKEGEESTVWDIAISPKSTELLVTAGCRILVYGFNGKIVRSIKGHEKCVYCVDFSHDGTRFASGGADNAVIVWSRKLEGLLKYRHGGAVQALKWNPVCMKLVSVGQTDFSIWSPDNERVQKFQLSNRGLCVAWSLNGLYFAIGTFNGAIHIYDANGEEKTVIERNAPVWCLAWSHYNEDNDMLTVGCWDKTLSFYDVNGQLAQKQRNLNFDPCSLHYYLDGDYLLISGSNQKVTLWTKEGLYLKDIASAGSWIWTAIPKSSESQEIICGTHSGVISYYDVSFGTVHGLYKDKYAYRDSITDVIIQHLITEQRVRIRTRDYVKKIAIYKDRLAVQLPDRILIYESGSANNPGSSYERSAGEDFDMHYKLRERILQKMECNLLVVTSIHIILCIGNVLQLYSFRGHKIREWYMDSLIRYIKVIGGPSGREGLLVGLKDGHVVKIFLDNRFHVTLLKHTSPIRCLDMSRDRDKVAIVDENATLCVYDLRSKKLLCKEGPANSVAWNTEFNDMLCYSDDKMVCVKTGTFPAHKQKSEGFVVGFKGSKVFCLQASSMHTVDVLQTVPMNQYMNAGDFQSAYKVACLGVTESDWNSLATRALKNLDLKVARKAFVNTGDIYFVDLVMDLYTKKRQGLNDKICHAEILAYRQEFDAAAEMYGEAGDVKRSIQMFLDLKEYDRVKDSASQILKTPESEELIDVLRNHAKHLIEINQFKAASEMLWAAQEYTQAIELMDSHGWLDVLIKRLRSSPNLDVAYYRHAASVFQKHQAFDYAEECYIKLNDVKAKLELYIQFENWDGAFKLVKEDRSLQEADIYLPYARHLALQDRFDQATDAFRLAGQPEEAINLLRQLLRTEIHEKRYHDVAKHYWLLAVERVKMAEGDKDDAIEDFWKNYYLAEAYYIYKFIHEFTHLPFISQSTETLFKMAQTVYNLSVHCEEIPRVATLRVLALTSATLQSFKVGRKAHSELLKLNIDPSWRAQLDASALKMRTKPHTDKDELIPVCYRCGEANPILNDKGEECVNCGNPFIRSFLSFDILPLVEFKPDPKLTPEETEELLKRCDDNDISDVELEDSNDEVQILDLGDASEDELNGGSATFFEILSRPENMTPQGGACQSLILHSGELAALDYQNVIIQNFGDGSLRRYFYNVFPEIVIAKCQTCQHCFIEDEFNFHLAIHDCCPLCQLEDNQANSDLQ